MLWGGREGYETLLNTDMKRELDNFGRFLSLVVEHKHKIGFKGTVLIEPKPHEPTKHQYDFDTATVYGFLKRYGLENEVKVNIEANHATLAGHTFEHELAMANALGIFGYGYLEQNAGVVRGVPLNGVAPTCATIASGAYPGARPLFIYVKKAHLRAIPGLRAFLRQYATLWGANGPLVKRGLIATPLPVQRRAAAIIASASARGWPPSAGVGVSARTSSITDGAGSES